MTLKEMLISERIIKIRKKDEEPFIVNELGTKSRLFIDIKEASLNPRILGKMVQHMISVMTNADLIFMATGRDFTMYLFDKICSVAIGSIPIATALSLEINIPQIIVRSEQHNRGTQSSIIGNCKDKKVILIEDVAVTGNAIIKGVNTIRENGGICDICIVVVDRQEGAEKNCLDKGIRLFSLLKKSDFGISLDE